jgi:N-methylhydantoinase A
VTDADLVLGRLDPDGFAGGTIALDAARASSALSEAVGGALGLDARAAAHGVSEVVDETMANAARVHAVENGEDLSGYTMIAFGGAAPLHAGRLAQKLGIARVLVPPGAGVGSAIGFLRAPFSFEATRSAYMRLGAFDAGAARALFAELAAEATGFVRGCDAEAPIATEARVYMRYVGQGWEIPVELSEGLAADPTAEALLARFREDYERLFGRTVEGLDVEATVWAVRAATPTPPSDPVGPVPEGCAPDGLPRMLFDPAEGRMLDGREVQRATLSPGDRVAGPAAVTEPETTVIVPRGFTLCRAADGCLDLTEDAS